MVMEESMLTMTNNSIINSTTEVQMKHKVGKTLPGKVKEGFYSMEEKVSLVYAESRNCFSMLTC